MRETTASTTSASSTTMATVAETLSFVYRCGWQTRLLFVVGTLGGIAHGLAYPMVAYFLSQTFETMSSISSPSSSTTDTTNNGTITITTATDSSSSSAAYDASLANIREISYTFLVLAFYSLGSAFLQTACFELLAYRATRLFQIEWFHALMRQDAAFFDIYSSSSNSSNNTTHSKKTKGAKGKKQRKGSKRSTAAAATISPASIVRYQQGIGRKLGELVQNLTTGIAGLVLGLVSSWKVSLLVFAILPLISAASLQVIRMNKTKTARASECYEQAGGIAYSTISSLRTILSLNAIEKRIEAYQQATQYAFDSATKVLVPMGLWTGSIMASSIGLFMAVVLFGSFVMYRDVRSTGCNPAGSAGSNGNACDNTGADIFSAMLGIVFAGQALSLLGNSLDTFAAARMATSEALRVINRVEGSPAKTYYKDHHSPSPLSSSSDDNNVNVNDNAIETEGGSNSQSIKTVTTTTEAERGNVMAVLPEYRINPLSEDGLKPENVQGGLVFQNVTFSYPTRPTVPILKDFSITIPAGKTVALVGPSGGGKSTVLSMIERFYDPLEGSILLDGTDIQKLNLSHYRSKLGYVGQEPSLFATTIRENIAFGAPHGHEASQEEIENAAKMANAHDDFIVSLPDGYDTQVGEKGAQLSGGQKQRIAIARTLLSKPQILCLDEATSALDSESELYVQHALDNILGQGSMTAVIVAHRLSTIRNADLIYVISGGGVVESGSHEELMDSEVGHYRNLVEKQEGTGDMERHQSDASLSSMASGARALDNQASSEFLTDNEGEGSASIVPLLEFRKVQFSYPSRPNKQILRKFNLSILPGETLALVGPSGQGKSTTVGLIERFYDPDDGLVLFKGHDIKTLNASWYRDQIGYVGQEPILFPGTVADNIAFGVPGATVQMIEDAAKEANIHDFVVSLPDKYNTEVGDSGAQLSGGQKQRVAIARALIKKPSILLLDEATSALDSESESIVQEALAKLMQSRNHTVIVIAHKLSSIRDCADHIAVVGGGKVQEIGSHEELMAKQRGKYKRLVEAQKRQTSIVLPRHNLGALAEESMDDSEQDDNAQDTKELKKDEKGAEVENTKSVVQRVKQMATPDLAYITIGSVGAVMSGAAYPVLGVLFAQTVNLFFFRVEPCSNDEMSSELGFNTCSEYWDDAAEEMQSTSFELAVYYTLVFFNSLIGAAVHFWGFGQASERISKRMRDSVFTALVRQEVGFFDCQNIGELKTRLQESTARLHAFTGAPVRQFLMAVSSLLIGLIISFFVMWPYAFLCIACMIPLVYASKLRSKTLGGHDEEDESSNTTTNASAGSIMVESLLHMKTIAALSLQQQKIAAFEAAVEESQKDSGRSSAFSGFMTGIGSFLQRCSNAVLYFWGGWLLLNYPGHFEFSDFLIAQLAFIFATLGLGAALQDIEDRDEVEASARWIFSILDRTSKIDPLSNEGKKLD